jgi:hypothetical protein
MPVVFTALQNICVFFGVCRQNIFHTTDKVHNAGAAQSIENGICPFFIGDQTGVF